MLASLRLADVAFTSAFRGDYKNPYHTGNHVFSKYFHFSDYKYLSLH